MVETLISTAIFVAVFTVAYQAYVTGSDNVQAKQAQTMLQDRGRVAMSIMVNELREAACNATTPSCDQTSTEQIGSPDITILAVPSNPPNPNDIPLLYFYLPKGLNNDGTIINSVSKAIDWDMNNKIQYHYVADTDKNVAVPWLLQRVGAGGNKTVITKNVASIQFTASSAYEIKIVLKLTEKMSTGRTLSETFTGLVKLRNSL
jgi:Tfp pilus assembly protein PilW